jgi:hypothetical protein
MTVRNAENGDKIEMEEEGFGRKRQKDCRKK